MNAEYERLDPIKAECEKLDPIKARSERLDPTKARSKRFDPTKAELKIVYTIRNPSFHYVSRKLLKLWIFNQTSNRSFSQHYPWIQFAFGADNSGLLKYCRSSNVRVLTFSRLYDFDF